MKKYQRSSMVMSLMGGCCLLLGVACGSSSNAPTSTSTPANCVATTDVTIKNYAFNPNCISVAAGTAVTFTNDDTVAHTATSVSGAAETFDSGTMNPNTTYTHTFETAGKTIDGMCSIHAYMTFQVVTH